MNTKHWLKDKLKQNNLFRSGFNLFRLILNLDPPARLFNNLAQQGLKPAQVDGYVYRFEDPYVEQFLALNLEKLNKCLNPGDCVLDVGCGTGRYLKQISKNYPVDLYGVDVAQATLENLTRKSCPEATLLVADFSKDNPFKEAKFNLIYSITVLEYISPFRVGKFFSNIAEALLPGGIFYLQFPHGNNLFEIFEAHRYHKYPAKFVEARLLPVGFRVIESDYLKPDEPENYGYYFVCMKEQL